VIEKRLVTLGGACLIGLEVASDCVLLLPSTVSRDVLVEVECSFAAWKRALFFGLFTFICFFCLPEYALDGFFRVTVVGGGPVCKTGSTGGDFPVSFVAARSAKLAVPVPVV